MQKEKFILCPVCGNTVYPKICPAVIVAIHDGDRLVLTKYKDRPVKHYALVAGFNEIGESIEETVHREVLEETGLRVRNLRFYKSQPWVFTPLPARSCSFPSAFRTCRRTAAHCTSDISFPLLPQP